MANRGREIESQTENEESSVCSKTVRQKGEVVILVLFASVDVLASAGVSLQAPFYPEVASQKGVSSTQYGLVFGVFDFTCIFASLIFGATMSYLGPRRTFVGGIVVTGICNLVFGCLHLIENGTTFLALSLLIRIIEAVGETAYVTASFTLIVVEFPENAAAAFAIFETCYGTGMIIGPSVGGVLYELGGYNLPFSVMGGTLLVLAFICVPICLAYPRQYSHDKPDLSEKEQCKKMSTLAFMKLPQVLITTSGVVTITTGIGFLSALLESHLRQFTLRKSLAGLVFLLWGGVYAITAPMWGWLCDHTKRLWLVSLVGSIFGIIGYMIIGPMPFIPTQPILWLTCVGLVIYGLAFGAIYVSGFASLHAAAVVHGYPDNIGTYGMISGLSNCMVCSGYFIGPTIGGVLNDLVGFRHGSLFILGLLIIHVLLLLVYIAWIHTMGKRT